MPVLPGWHGCLGCDLENEWQINPWRIIPFSKWLPFLYFNGLAEGKIYRKPLFLPSNIGLSCKFAHHPIL